MHPLWGWFPAQVTAPTLHNLQRLRAERVLCLCTVSLPAKQNSSILKTWVNWPRLCKAGKRRFARVFFFLNTISHFRMIVWFVRSIRKMENLPFSTVLVDCLWSAWEAAALVVMSCGAEWAHICLHLWGELMLFTVKDSLLFSSRIVKSSSEEFLNYKIESLLGCTEHEDSAWEAQAACIAASCKGRRNPGFLNCSSGNKGRRSDPDGHSFSVHVVQRRALWAGLAVAISPRQFLF